MKNDLQYFPFSFYFSEYQLIITLIFALLLVINFQASNYYLYEN